MDPEEIISHSSPAPSRLPHLFISLNSNPFLSKFCSGKKFPHIISLLFYSGTMSQHTLFNPEIVALQRKHNGYNVFGLVPNSRDTPVYYVSQEWTSSCSTVQYVVNSCGFKRRRIFCQRNRFEICFKQSRGKLN